MTISADPSQLNTFVGAYVCTGYTGRGTFASHKESSRTTVHISHLATHQHDNGNNTDTSLTLQTINLLSPVYFLHMHVRLPLRGPPSCCKVFSEVIRTSQGHDNHKWEAMIALPGGRQVSTGTSGLVRVESG
jgi:hypothetical protein